MEISHMVVPQEGVMDLKDGLQGSHVAGLPEPAALRAAFFFGSCETGSRVGRVTGRQLQNRLRFNKYSVVIWSKIII